MMGKVMGEGGGEGSTCKNMHKYTGSRGGAKASAPPRLPLSLYPPNQHHLRTEAKNQDKNIARSKERHARDLEAWVLRQRAAGGRIAHQRGCRGLNTSKASLATEQSHKQTHIHSKRTALCRHTPKTSPFRQIHNRWPPTTTNSFANHTFLQSNNNVNTPGWHIGSAILSSPSEENRAACKREAPRKRTPALQTTPQLRASSPHCNITLPLPARAACGYVLNGASRGQQTRRQPTLPLTPS